MTNRIRDSPICSAAGNLSSFDSGGWLEESPELFGGYPMAKRIYSDQELLERRRARQRAYYNANKNNPEFIERRRTAARKYQRRKCANLPKIEKPIIKITMEELETWVKFRKKFGDPEKYDWKGDL